MTIKSDENSCIWKNVNNDVVFLFRNQMFKLYCFNFYDIVQVRFFYTVMAKGLGWQDMSLGITIGITAPPTWEK